MNTKIKRPFAAGAMYAAFVTGTPGNIAHAIDAEQGTSDGFETPGTPL